MQIKTPFWIVILTLWFALLQSMAPLTHAHLNGESALDDGPHMHFTELQMQASTTNAEQSRFHWHVHTNKTPGMVIGMTPALTAQGFDIADASLLDSPPWALPWLALLVLALCVFAKLAGLAWQHPPPWRSFVVYFHLITPRAPPKR